MRKITVTSTRPDVCPECLTPIGKRDAVYTDALSQLRALMFGGEISLNGPVEFTTGMQKLAREVKDRLAIVDAELATAKLPICVDCGSRPDAHQQEYYLDCKCGGVWMSVEKAIDRWNLWSDRWAEEKKKLRDELATAHARIAELEVERDAAVKRDPRRFVDQQPPPEGRVVFIDGGVAEYRNGVWYTGMEDPRYQRPIQWEVTWWMPLNPWTIAEIAAARAGKVRE